jgi:hypothetical protein
MFARVLENRGKLLVTLKTISRLTAALGFLSSLLVFLLIAINVVTGVSQEYFESTHPAREYTERIVRDAGPLNLDFTVDNLFVVSYATFFVGLGIMFHSRAHSLLVKLGVGAMLFVASLDSVENHHITAMAQAALSGVPLLNEEIRAQVIMSSLKFHVSCFGALLFAAVFARESRIGRVVSWLFLGYGFFGILVLTSPPLLLLTLSLLRTAFFVFAFFLSAVMLWNWTPTSETVPN